MKREHKPLIGVTPQWDAEQQRMWMRPNYMDCIFAEGAVPVLFPVTDNEEDIRRLVGSVDGVLLTGGPDIDPALFGEEPLEGAPFNHCPVREKLDMAVFRIANELGKPVFGICLGMQIINVALGGTLWQDIPLQHPNRKVHQQPKPYDVPFHEVTLIEGTPMQKLLGTDRIRVNSCHHQAVKDLAPELTLCAVSEDGVTEAFCRENGSFIWGVQWHPEHTRLTDGYSQKLFGPFIDAVKQNIN